MELSWGQLSPSANTSGEEFMQISWLLRFQPHNEADASIMLCFVYELKPSSLGVRPKTSSSCNILMQHVRAIKFRVCSSFGRFIASKEQLNVHPEGVDEKRESGVGLLSVKQRRFTSLLHAVQQFSSFHNWLLERAELSRTQAELRVQQGKSKCWIEKFPTQIAKTFRPRNQVLTAEVCGFLLSPFRADRAVDLGLTCLNN